MSHSTNGDNEGYASALNEEYVSASNQSPNNKIHNKMRHRIAFKPTLNRISSKAFTKRIRRSVRNKNKMLNQLLKKRENYTDILIKTGQNPNTEMNSRYPLLLMKNDYIRSLVNRLQTKYQTIMNAVLTNYTKKTYNKEITLFMYGHGMDMQLKNNMKSPICNQDLFHNVRIFGLKRTNRHYPAAMHLEDEDEELRFYYNFKNIIYEMLINQCFEMSMKDRERLIEAIFKVHFAFFPDKLLSKYPKLMSSIQHFINPEVGHFRPVMEHLWSIEHDTSINSGEHPTGTFMVINSTIPEDIPHTCNGNKIIDVNRQGMSPNHLLKDPYWINKLRLDVITDTHSGDRYLLLSELIWKLKSSGYEKIHIVDVSCRATDIKYVKGHQVTAATDYIQQLRSDYDDPLTIGSTITAPYSPIINPRRFPIMRRKLKRPPAIVSATIQRQRSEKQTTCVQKAGAFSIPKHTSLLPFNQDALLQLLREDLRSTHSLEHTHMYKMYKKIIPNTPLLQNRTQALYIWYLMLVLGYIGDEYERQEECILILKGGKSIQLLVDGRYDSTDIDIKILDIEGRPSDAKSKKEIAEELAHKLSYGLSNISILPPNPELNNTIYKVTLVQNGEKIALVDIDFKELVCSEGKEDEMECRLKRIFSRIETNPIFIDNLPFIQSYTLNYNTYPVTIQIKEKTELIKEYRRLLREGINKKITEDPVITDELEKLFISFELGKPRYFTGDMLQKLAALKYSKDIIDKIHVFISDLGLGPVFFIQKFERGLNGLLLNCDKIRQKTIQVANQAVIAVKQRIQRIEALRRQHHLYSSAAHQTALIAATKRLQRLEQIEREKYEKQRHLHSITAQQTAIAASNRRLQLIEKEAHQALKRAQHELELKQYFDAEDQEELYEDARNNHPIETSKNRFNRTHRELERIAHNPSAKKMVENNLKRFVNERNAELQKMANSEPVTQLALQQLLTKKKKKRKPSSTKSVARASANSNSNSNNISRLSRLLRKDESHSKR